ncbi:MAG: hypothetical protein Q9M34_04040 [Sulfurimonas sp.]|nr:hypothetical protein [Sulfurimonas sp.]
MQRGRSAIALLITLMFVIVITVAIGYGLGQVNDASQIVQEENALYQRNIIVEDILNILRTSKELEVGVDNNSSSDLYLLLSQVAFIPFEYKGVEILLRIKSARMKFNPAMLTPATGALLSQYLGRYNINASYIDILFDNINGIPTDNSYNSTIFDENPYLFRDYIASAKHLERINDFYTKEYHDNALSNVDFSQLFYYTPDRNISIDVNYATPEVWEFMLGCTRDRAEVLNAAGGSYSEINDLNLNDDEKEILTQNFQISFFEPIVQIDLDITLNGAYTKMSFEYNIQTKKGSNFVYEL